MTLEYRFKVDVEAEEFCDRIAMRMVRLFGFTLEEAIARINNCWTDRDFRPYPTEGESPSRKCHDTDIRENISNGAVSCERDSQEGDSDDMHHDIRYHEDSDFWANEITYGSDSHWWLDPPDLKPLPYP